MKLKLKVALRLKTTYTSLFPSTWNNAQLGAAQIKQLEENTSRISRERTEYIEKLQAEVEARENETGKKVSEVVKPD